MVSDEQLIFTVAEGDASCLGTLFERHFDAVCGFCTRLTKDRALGEDLASETFFRMLDKAGSFSGKGSFKGWMFHIAHNLTMDHLRKSGRWQADDDLAEHTPDDLTQSPEEAADSFERLDLLQRAIDELTPAARAVLWLGRFECERYSELAQALDCSEGAARVRMHRVMGQLKRIYHAMQQEISHA